MPQTYTEDFLGLGVCWKKLALLRRKSANAGFLRRDLYWKLQILAVFTSIQKINLFIPGLIQRRQGSRFVRYLLPSQKNTCNKTNCQYIFFLLVELLCHFRNCCFKWNSFLFPASRAAVRTLLNIYDEASLPKWLTPKRC